MTHFDDFDDGDELSKLFDNAKAGPKPAPQLPQGFVPNTERVFTEPCSRCRGSGRYGNLGPCFKCKGKGTFTFKTSREERTAKRGNAHARKARVETERRESVAAAAEAFETANPAIMTWLRAAARRHTENATSTFDFPVKMLDAVRQYGSLTDGQLGAISKLMARDVERKAAAEARKAAAPTVEIAKVEAAFEHARNSAAGEGEGVKWLRLRLDTFTFADAPARPPYPAAIFVKEGEQKLGRIVGGKFLRSFVCTEAQEQRILVAASDPAAAAVAYGQRTGSCSVCGRELTNAESRARGIGPICAERYGW